MKIDTYTRFILSIIAFALVSLVFQNTFSASAAGVQKVAICDTTGARCAFVLRTNDGFQTLAVLDNPLPG